MMCGIFCCLVSLPHVVHTFVVLLLLASLQVLWVTTVAGILVSARIPAAASIPAVAGISALVGVPAFDGGVPAIV